MANPLTRNLASLFRSQARPTSLKRLEREGIRTVGVLDLSRLEGIVGEAIETALRDLSPEGVSPGRIAEGAQVELLRILGDGQRLGEKNDELRREQNSLEGDLSLLQGALEQSRKELESTVEKADHEAMLELRARLDASLNEVFGRAVKEIERKAPGAGAAVDSLQRPLKDAMLALLAAALRRSRPGAPSDAEMKVELLERRIKKLSATLDETETLLDRVRQGKAAEVEGVPSIYREAQGIHGSGVHIEQRKALMREIFQHNVDLRKTIQGGA